MRFKGKLALVTAGTRGIGRAAAEALRSEGADVAICGRDEATQKRTAEAIGAFGLSGDIGDAAFLERLVRETEAKFGRTIDVLVANNGGPPATTSEETTEEQWAGALARNLMSAVRLTKLVAPGMKAKGWGRIVHLASTTAKEPDEGMTLSNTTRAATVAFAKTTSRELGPFGITVNTVLTGAVLTDRLRGLIAGGSGKTGAELDAEIEAAAKAFPVRYIPEPPEFAKIVLFLASEEARYLTGVALPADGGYVRSAM